MTRGVWAVLIVGVAVAAPVPKSDKPKVGETNTNELVKAHKDKLKLDATSTWGDPWPVENLIDGKDETTWYSKDPDSTLTKQLPAVTLTFPEDVKLKRITVMGNRDPQYLTGYTVSEGTIDLLDKDGKVVSTHELKGKGEKSDFDLILEKFATVRAVRFTATKSENGYVGLGEVMVE